MQPSGRINLGTDAEFDCGVMMLLELGFNFFSKMV